MKSVGKWFCAVLWLMAGLGTAQADYGTDQTSYAATGRFDLIEKQVEAMAQQGPLRTRDQHALCFAYSKLKRYDRLMPCLDTLQALVDKGDRRTRIFGLDDATPAIHLLRAEAFTDLGNYAGARKEANNALVWLRRENSGDDDMVVTPTPPWRWPRPCRGMPSWRARRWNCSRTTRSRATTSVPRPWPRPGPRWPWVPGPM